MRDANVRQQRKAMLDLPHIAPLTAYAAGLRRDALEVPDFDPLDGGVDARVLFLLEKPGPMTSELGKRTGSGFISRDNDDATAEATFTFMKRAGIPRELTVIWNVVPSWNGTRKVTAQEIAQGAACVTKLVGLLPALAAVVLVGGRAARAKPFLEGTNLALFTSCHPSPLVRARYRAMWETIPLQWAKAMAVVEESLCPLPGHPAYTPMPEDLLCQRFAPGDLDALGAGQEDEAVLRVVTESPVHLACHEAGHAVMAHWLGYDLNQCQIQMNRLRGPKLSFQGLFNARGCEVPKSDELLRVLGGPVAEGLSRRESPNRFLIVLRQDHPDAPNILRLTKILSGGRAPSKLQLEYQKMIVPILKAAWPAIEELSSRLVADLATADEAVLLGGELHRIMIGHNITRRQGNQQGSSPS